MRFAYAKDKDPRLAPKRATEGSSGLDLSAAEEVYLRKGEIKLIPTGILVQLDHGTEGQIRPRSGLASRGITATLGTIDSDYRSELKVILANLSQADFRVEKYMRIAQLVVSSVLITLPVEQEIELTDRGGFGSTGN